MFQYFAMIWYNLCFGFREYIVRERERERERGRERERQLNLQSCNQRNTHNWISNTKQQTKKGKKSQ